MSQRSALINIATGLVENLIVADAAVDAAEPGYVLIAEPPPHVRIGSVWDGSAFEPAPPPLQVVRAVTPPPTVINGLEML